MVKSARQGRPVVRATPYRRGRRRAQAPASRCLSRQPSGRRSRARTTAGRRREGGVAVHRAGVDHDRVVGRAKRCDPRAGIALVALANLGEDARIVDVAALGGQLVGPPARPHLGPRR